MGQPRCLTRRLPCASTCARMNAIYARCSAGLRCVCAVASACFVRCPVRHLAETSGQFFGERRLRWSCSERDISPQEDSRASRLVCLFTRFCSTFFAAPVLVCQCCAVQHAQHVINHIAAAA